MNTSDAAKLLREHAKHVDDGPLQTALIMGAGALEEIHGVGMPSRCMICDAVKKDEDDVCASPHCMRALSAYNQAMFLAYRDGRYTQDYRYFMEVFRANRTLAERARERKLRGEEYHGEEEGI